MGEQEEEGSYSVAAVKLQCSYSKVTVYVKYRYNSVVVQCRAVHCR